MEGGGGNGDGAVGEMGELYDAKGRDDGWVAGGDLEPEERLREFMAESNRNPLLDGLANESGRREISSVEIIEDRCAVLSLTKSVTRRRASRTTSARSR